MKIFFHAVDGIGHLNACVGLAQALTDRGHQVYFLLNGAFKGQYEKYGFKEILLHQVKQSAPETAQASSEGQEEEEPRPNPVKEMAEKLIASGFLGPKSPLEKLKVQVATKIKKEDDFMESFYNQAVEFNSQINDAIEKEKPDLFIIDSFLIPPSVRMAKVPWIYSYSSNPIYLYQSDKLPPFGSGYPSNCDPALAKEYRDLFNGHYETNYSKYHVQLNQEFNYEPQNANETGLYAILSPYLNVYGFPAELDYDDLAPRPENIVGLDAFCRDESTLEKFELPEGFLQPGEKLIYFSLGSMGSVDVNLMKRIVSVLATTPHKYIVSKGQRSDEFDLPANCWGEKHLPQTKILPMVDLVITHGGNNTITETMTYGKPMIVMPLFGDQYDNAQRVQEKGFGSRLEPYQFEDEQLTGAIDKLLNDSDIQERAQKAAQRMQKTKSKEKVCERIEQVVRDYRIAQQ